MCAGINKKTIISITPIALQRDSRTLKMAASFARLGYRSIVVERLGSEENFGALGIEVISVNKVVPVSSEHSYPNHSYSRKILKFFWHLMRSLGLGYINDYLSFQEFKRNFKKEYSLESIQIPEGDIYVFHSYEFLEFALSLKKDTKIIYDAHDFYQEINPLDDESKLVKKWIMPFRWDLERKLIDRCDVFLTVSPGLEKKYLNASGKRPFVIQNAHDTRNDYLSKKSVRDYLNLGANDNIVCCVGNKKKGMVFEQLLDVFSKNIPNMHLVFIGNGYDYSSKSSPNIHSIPALNPNELVPFLRTANMGIVPYFGLSDNYKSALPNGFFQLIASELPLVFSTELVEINHFNQQYNFGIATNIKQEKDIVKTLKEIDNNYTTFKTNIAKASQRLSWPEEEKKLKPLLYTLNKAID